MNGCIYHTTDGLCMKFSVGDVHSWCVGEDEPCDYRRQSNADRIRSMTDEELARFMAHYDSITEVGEQLAYERWLDWLKEEEQHDPD